MIDSNVLFTEHNAPSSVEAAWSGVKYLSFILTTMAADGINRLSLVSSTPTPTPSTMEKWVNDLSPLDIAKTVCAATPFVIFGLGGFLLATRLFPAATDLDTATGPNEDGTYITRPITFLDRIGSLFSRKKRLNQSQIDKLTGYGDEDD